MFNSGNSNEERFADLASGIVSTSDSNSASGLEDAIVKVADDQDLNSEQIRRLTEAVNHATYAKMLNSPDRKFDKSAEFPLVDPKIVISRFYKTSSSADMAKVASEVSSDLSDYYTSPEKFYTPLTKTASSSETSLPSLTFEEKTPLYKEDALFEKLSYAKKIRDTLYNEMLSEKIKILDCIDKIASEVMYTDSMPIEILEKKAFLLFGDECVPLLNVVRSQLHMDSIEGFNKTAEYDTTGTILLDSREPELLLIKQALDSSKAYYALKNKHEQFVAVLGE